MVVFLGMPLAQCYGAMFVFCVSRVALVLLCFHWQGHLAFFVPRISLDGLADSQCPFGGTGTAHTILPGCWCPRIATANHQAALPLLSACWVGGQRKVDTPPRIFRLEGQRRLSRAEPWMRGGHAAGDGGGPRLPPGPAASQAGGAARGLPAGPADSEAGKGVPSSPWGPTTNVLWCSHGRRSCHVEIQQSHD